MIDGARPQDARRPLRVAMVHYSDFHLDSRIQRQALALAERGDRVELVCLSDPATVPAGQGSIHLHRVPGGKASGGAGAYLGGYARFFAGALRRVTALGRLDLVEVHNMPDFLVFAAAWPRLRGTPVILNVHDTFPELFATKFGRGPGDPLVRLLALEERASARFADALITVTAEAGELLAARGSAPPRRLVVMNSPDERVFGPQRQPVPPPAGEPVRILYHGGLAPRFGVELLVRAVARTEDVSLRICGTGPERDDIATLAAALAPGRIDVAPEPVPFRMIPRELERAHVGVVPTIRDPFTELLLPVKLLEYVHMGLPAIAPRLPVIERHFTDREVRFFEPGSVDSLAAAIAAVVADPDAACRRAARASRRLSELAWERQRREYLQLVDDLAVRAEVRGRPGRSSGARVEVAAWNS